MTVRSVGRLTSDEVGTIRNLVAEATTTDGIPPLSDDTFLRVSADPATAGQHLILADPEGDDTDCGGGSGGISGYAYVANGPAQAWQAELVVRPGRRGRGLGGQLLAALTGTADGAGASLDIWAHGHSPAAGALARRHGFTRERVLWQMHRPLTGSPPLPEVNLPPGMTVRTFIPGQDDQRWLALNRRAFADHPEQGRWSIHDLALRQAEPWFDPAGFFLTESSGQLVGFHWTKVHAEQTGRMADGAGVSGPVVGEVYVVGVDPVFAGRGLGRALTVIGLRHLRDRGLPTVMLYVDDANRGAMRLYDALGFTRYRADISYRRLPASLAGPHVAEPHVAE